MGDALSDAYRQEREWNEAIKEALKADDKASEDKEYKDLVAAHIAVSHILRQSAALFKEITEKRIAALEKINGKYLYETLLSDMDARLERSIISEWELRNLIK